MNAPYELANAMARTICGMPPAFTSSPTADAEDHFDDLADTWEADVNYLGLKLHIEVSRSGNHIVDLIGEDGTGWYELLSEKALRQVRKLAEEGIES